MGYDDDPLVLFSPYKLGNNRWKLSHRVVMAPLTRCRALNGIPNEALVEYYSQRTTNGGLIISEGTFISPTAHGYLNVPGVYTAEQVAAWKKVTAAVHAKGGVIFCQLWHCGRASHHVYQPGGAAPISSTNQKIPTQLKIQLPNGSHADYSTPRALSADEIPEIVDQFAQSASNAIEAGFDGVEIHGGSGYLIDQFLTDQANDRVDHYGGSLLNRIRFLDEVVRAVAQAVGPDRVGLKISPTVSYKGCAADSDPMALGLAVVEKVNEIQEQLGCGLTYVHVQLGSSDSNSNNSDSNSNNSHKEADRVIAAAMRNKYRGTFMVCGGYSYSNNNNNNNNKELGIKAVQQGFADLVGYGRAFLSNPDFVRRLELDAPLNHCDYSTFSIHDPVVGYTDYPFLSLDQLQHY